MEFICSICDKSLSNHKAILRHRRNVHEIYCVPTERRKDETTNCYSCQYCKKSYTTATSRWIHEKKCKIHKEEERKIALTEEENNRYRMQIAELQEKLSTMKKIENKTFRSLNKVLIERSDTNYPIVSFGNEDTLNVLTDAQKKQILDCGLQSLEKLVELIHCGEFTQFKNVIITNLKDNYAYMYDASKNSFITVMKNLLLSNIIDMRIKEIKTIYTELNEADKIDKKTKDVIQKFLDKMENESPVVENDTKFENYRSFKAENIKILLYNNLDKITKNIALLISDKPDMIENILITE